MGALLIDIGGFASLLDELRGDGYALLGPVLRDGAICYGSIEGPEDLPKGWTDRQDAGEYRLEHRGDDALFSFNVGPHSWKQFFFPPRERLWQLSRREAGFERLESTESERPEELRRALIGVRACELAAIQIQDRVFMSRAHVDPGYARRRDRSFIVAVNCGQAGGACFCDSMGTGPRCESGFDLALTELLGDGGPRYVVEVGSEAGGRVMTRLATETPTEDDLREARACTDRARAQMGRVMQTDGLPDLLQRNLEHPIWDEIAQRCLSCANCTLVCPTCFCSSVEDTSDLSGDIAERWRQWDSCFNGDFSRVHAGRIRSSTASRYRQWLTHKLSTWHEQFGSSGCVGCGRCITWCPVGIDITIESQSIRQRNGERKPARSTGAEA